MSYELRALAGTLAVAAEAARAVGGQLVPLPQGFGLVPATAQVADGLGGDPASAFPDVFWFLSAGLAGQARQVSAAGDIAYLEADIFGGTGTQAMVVWRAGRVALGPDRTMFAPGLDRRAGAVNRALRELGVSAGPAGDEFAALGLGQRRHTADWLTTEGTATP